MEQMHKRETDPEDQETQATVDERTARELSETAERAAKIDEDIDGLLADIDSVLEENPEAFVDSFVQKGGQ